MNNLSDEEIENIRYMCLDDSTKIIQYLEEQKSEQDKQAKIDRLINIAVLLIAIATLIVTIVM